MSERCCSCKNRTLTVVIGANNAGQDERDKASNQSGLVHKRLAFSDNDYDKKA